MLARLAIPASDNTILRHLKRHTVASTGALPIRVAGIDDWSWRKGFTYGTIIVDLQRRNVVDVLPCRSAKETAEWLAQHPEIEIVSRDRCGLYAQGIREGAPQAKQVADRFHLLQNLRESIERQMSNVSRFAGRSLLAPVLGEHNNVSREARRNARKSMFDRVQNLHAVGKSLWDICKKPESAGERWQNRSSQIVRRSVKPHLRSQVLQAISRIFCGVSGRRVTGAAVIFFRTFDAVVTQGVTLTWNGYCRSGDRRAGVTGMRQKPRFKKTGPSTQRQGGKSRQSSQRRCA